MPHPHILPMSISFLFQVGQLVEEVQRLQTTLGRMRETSGAQLTKLEQELTTKTRLAQELEQRLAIQHDYSDIKRELEYASCLVALRHSPLVP